MKKQCTECEAPATHFYHDGKGNSFYRCDSDDLLFRESLAETFYEIIELPTPKPKIKGKND